MLSRCVQITTPLDKTTWIAGIVLAATLAIHSHSAGALAVNSSLHVYVETAAQAGAMMVPLAGLSTNLVFQRSLRHRRLLAVGEYLLGFFLIWMAYGLVITLLVKWLNGIRPALPFTCLVALAAAWQLSSSRRRQIKREGRLRTSPPTGWRSDFYATIAGAREGGRC
jgi:hypothetical protein